MKRVLMVATVPSMIGQFNMNNIRLLKSMGYEVDVAADFTDLSVWTTERIEAFKAELKRENIKWYQIDFSRSALNIMCHVRSYREILSLIRKRKYSFIHTHTPIASAIVRLSALISHTSVIYTAHGFHFYKGAPLKNWLIYFPVEWLCSFFTDVLITINKEDYRLAKRHMHARKVVYVPGVGVDTTKFKYGNRQKIRNELGISDNEIMLLSVGELNENKNHITVINALSKLKDPPVYVIVGQGDLADHLKSEAHRLGVRVIMTGYRKDVVDMYAAADIYILPSLREGLNVSLMEAMASGLPCIAGKIRGNVDLIRDGVNGYLCRPNDTKGFAIKIRKLCLNKEIRSKFSTTNLEKIQDYNTVKINYMMKRIYETV